MYVYAQINKETLRFIREKKAVSYDYVVRLTKYSKEKIALWEDETSEKYPTINQAKAIAKCYRVPFAGLYMNASDINVKHLPKIRNLRTLPDAVIDNSALNLAISDVLCARDLLIDTKKELKEPLKLFELSAPPTDDISQWARMIRKSLELDADIQYKLPSSRQLYLYIRNAVENAGVFVHCFTGIDTDIVRGFAVFDEQMPIIGLNNEDRYPAKSFSIIHELVHLLKRSSAVCNEMINNTSSQAEEVFCNAVAGEVLVPRLNLLKQLGSYTDEEIDFGIIDSLATKFSVSKEVVCRRLFDINKISAQHYSALSNTIRVNFENERDRMKEHRRLTGQGIPRNISREAIDQNSSALCRTFYHGYREGVFDKQDVARYLGIKQSHIDKFMWEVAKW